MPLERVTILCFAASYAVALGLELWNLVRPRPILRLVSQVFGGAGLFAHTIYVAFQPMSLASPQGSLLFLGWILAVFYFYGSIHHGRLAWGLFVLPLVLGLVGLADVIPVDEARGSGGLFSVFSDFRGERFWGAVHGTLVLLAAVGVCVGFVASVMYLVQVQRLRAKVSPGHGMRMLSLERIEGMNRRAILAAFPLLTLGLLVGVALQLQAGAFFQGWTSPRILSVIGLWLVFAILLYLRYGAHARGRQVALFTILAFALLVSALTAAHPFAMSQ